MPRGGIRDSPNYASRIEDKVAWLVDRRHLWDGIATRGYCYVPNATGRDYTLVLRNLAAGMKAAGLYSPQTYIRDVEHSVYRYIQRIQRTPGRESRR